MKRPLWGPWRDTLLGPATTRTLDGLTAEITSVRYMCLPKRLRIYRTPSARARTRGKALPRDAILYDVDLNHVVQDVPFVSEHYAKRFASHLLKGFTLLERMKRRERSRRKVTS